MITIILTGSCVSAELCRDGPLIPVKYVLTGLESFRTVERIYQLINHVWDIYKAEKKDWKDLHSGAKVCKCVLCVIVSYLYFFFQESHDQHLWSKICSAVIKGIVKFYAFSFSALYPSSCSKFAAVCTPSSNLPR